MNPRAQWLTLLLLSGLWAGLLLWRIADTPEPTRVPLKYVTGQAASREDGRGKPAAGMKIRMDLLEAGRRQAAGTFVAPKNIFAPLLREAPKVKVAGTRPGPSSPPSPPDVAQAPAAPTNVVPVAPPGPTPEELAAQAALQAAQAELAQYRYLGYLSRQGRQEAFLSKGKELLIVRAGETIEQRVLVKAVSPTGVSLQETRANVEKTILLAGEDK